MKNNSNRPKQRFLRKELLGFNQEKCKHFSLLFEPNGLRGHGYAAEYANNTMDRVMAEMWKVLRSCSGGQLVIVFAISVWRGNSPNKKISKMLQKMFQADDRRQYARTEIMQVAIVEVTQKRSHITQTKYEQGFWELIEESV